MTGLRVDKWLWAARFFKTRSLAAKACDLGRVEANGTTCKPAREVHAGDLLTVKNAAGEFQVHVRQLSDVRGPAPVAQTLYEETAESRDARLRAAQERKAAAAVEPVRQGKPSKRDRRRLDRFRGRM